ncbi:DCC1-like thiol-disulfide oxidoreductase family protein [Verrucomicrobiales bacterium BCK34]|nr:DCC1-like thiol-disulfide oxidoreductase family protein [Verrucomicrobiales bacterium BCK34]
MIQITPGREMCYRLSMGWVLFFDGDCAFCSAGVRRAMRFDRQRRLKFSPLQGKLAAEKGFTEFSDEATGTMVLMREEDGRVFLRSDAAIQLARVFGGPWLIFLPAFLIPRFIRDAAYKWVARNRYLFSKKKDFCVLPDPEFEARVIE